MKFKEKLTKGLESIVKKNVAPIAITAVNVPLHETLHATCAVVLPNVHSEGIALNSAKWYSKPLEYITFGYFQSTEMQPHVAGFAKISVENNFLGHLSSAVTAGLPEIATMTLGMYWINKAVNDIKVKGEKISALIKTFCAYELISGVNQYYKFSNMNPEQGQDYYSFTESVLKMTGLPGGAADYVTFVGTAMMVTAALYLTNLISKRFIDKNDMSSILDRSGS